jgi:hypothetical protein
VRCLVLKVTPAVLLPLVLMLAPRRQFFRALASCLLAAVIPFLWVLLEGGHAASNVWQMLAYQLNRQLEIERVLATPFRVGTLAGVSSVEVGLAAGSQFVVSSAADLLAKLSSGVLPLTLGRVGLREGVSEH